MNVNGSKAHEIESEFSPDRTGDFELNGLTISGRVEHKTNTRFRNMDDFECYINARDIEYDSEVVTFTLYD